MRLAIKAALPPLALPIRTTPSPSSKRSCRANCPMPNDLRTALLEIVTSPIFQQVFPLIVLIAGPAVVLFCTSALRKNMVFDSWSLWPFSAQASSSGSSPTKRKERKLRKHRSPNDTAVELSETKRACPLQFKPAPYSYCASGGGSYYPGLVNISGTYCFMNSTLQVRGCLLYDATLAHPSCV